MKKSLVALLLSFSSIALMAQTIPNSSFESWVSYSAFGERPTEWTTTDSITMTLSSNITHTATKVTDASSGSYALKLVSAAVTVPIIGTTINGPGIATNGKIAASLTSFTFDGGSPTSVRSRYFGGKFKYAPAAATDAAVFTVALLRRNPLNGLRDTIAFGSDTVDHAVSAYTPFSVMLNYRDYLYNPDSCLILIQSSRAINDPGWAAGSELIVDELSFTGTVGLDEVNAVDKAFSVYPSPATTVLKVKMSMPGNSTILQVMDINGKEVLRRVTSVSEQQLDVSSLPEGNYFVNLVDANDKVLASRRFIVAR
jgi:hypothetical protein